jgi:EPS-associated MarR family transcriptional regulator
MNKKNDIETLLLLRNIHKKPRSSQRKLAKDIGYSIGKLNYCLKKLQQKGLIKYNNFKKNPKKINYFYILTPAGLAAKSKITLNYMERISKEYDELKKEID